MLSRREFGGGLAAGAVVRRRGSEKAAPPPPANEPNLARILRTKRLRVAGLVGEAPYSYKDPASGRWGGICITLAGNLAAELGAEITVVESSWSDLAVDVHSGRVDLSFLNPTAQRGMFVDFASPLLYDAYGIVARKGFDARSWAEINVPERLVAVDEGSARDEVTRRLAGNAAITGFKTREEAMAAIQSGRVDCFVTTALFALAVVKKDPSLGDFIAPTPYLRAAVCPGMPYDDDRRLRGVVDAWREDHRATGRIRELLVADLAKFSIQPGDLPPEISFLIGP